MTTLIFSVSGTSTSKCSGQRWEQNKENPSSCIQVDSVINLASNERTIEGDLQEIKELWEATKFSINRKSWIEGGDKFFILGDVSKVLDNLLAHEVRRYLVKAFFVTHPSSRVSWTPLPSQSTQPTSPKRSHIGRKLSPRSGTSPESGLPSRRSGQICQKPLLSKDSRIPLRMELDSRTSTNAM